MTAPTSNPTIQPLCTTCLRRTGCTNVTNDHSGCLHYSPVSGAVRPTVCDIECKRRVDSVNGCAEWVRVESCEKWQHMRGAKAETVAAGGMIREVEAVEAPGNSSPSQTLAEAHWYGYVQPLLEAHGTGDEQINLIRFHYLSAFQHGYKHGVARVGGKA